MYAFRELLDERAAAFRRLHPPVHWDQLYDMPNAWEDRVSPLTKAIVEKEAAKGRPTVVRRFILIRVGTLSSGRYSLGRTVAGPRPAVVRRCSLIRLKLALHCPLETWVSHQLSWV